MVVNDKQLFTNAAQLLQNKLDLLDTMNFTEVGVDHDHAAGVDLHVIASQQLGRNIISRLQHRADGRYFRGIIREEMNKH